MRNSNGQVHIVMVIILALLAVTVYSVMTAPRQRPSAAGGVSAKSADGGFKDSAFKNLKSVVGGDFFAKSAKRTQQTTGAQIFREPEPEYHTPAEAQRPASFEEAYPDVARRKH